MYDLFHADALTLGEARLAFPLVCLAEPAITLDDWLHVVQRYACRTPLQSGLIAIRDGRGYVHALYAFGTERTLLNRTRLRVTDMVIGHLPGSALRDAILTSAEGIAATLGCDTLIIDVPTRELSGPIPVVCHAMIGPHYRPAAVSFARNGPA